jgi:hypothetical protein
MSHIRGVKLEKRIIVPICRLNNVQRPSIPAFGCLRYLAQPRSDSPAPINRRILGPYD